MPPQTTTSTPYQDPTNSGRHNGSWKFPNPFFDIASEYIPNDMHTILEWAEYIYMTFGTWRSASRKVVRYFLTEIILEGESDEEREDYQTYLEDDLHLLTELAQIGDDFMVYGNVFVSIYFPFDRFFICPQCRTEFHNDVVKYTFDAANLEFTSKCAKCQYAGPFGHEDRRSPDRSRVKLIRWNPKQIRLIVHPVSGDIQYFWDIPTDFINKLRAGDDFFLKSTPWSIIKCLKADGDGGGGHLFEFRKDSIYHFKETTLAGLPIVGWGIPSIIPNFKLAYYIQVLRRADEAIALDYIMPFRVLYPDSTGAGSDPLQLHASDIFVGKMQNMVRRHRNDPTTVQIAPYKVGYQVLGGEGNELTPKDQIAQALDELLNSFGYPAELYKGSLNIQAFPVALRLFEKTWGSMVDGYNDLIGWILTSIAQHFMWGEITGKLRSVTLADDIERKALALQAAAGMDVSKGTAYKPFGIDYMDEQNRIVEEQQAIQQLQQKAMDDQQAQQGLEGGQGGGGQGGPGGEAGATPGDVHEQAKQLAQQLLFQTPETLRRGELMKIKHSNPTLHALVMQEMDTVRQDMNRQGGAAMMEQAKSEQQGAGGGMIATAGAEWPDPIHTISMIADGLLMYTPTDMQKIAMDVKQGIKGADQAFHFMYFKMRGWT
jgi:hypothetical protein